MRAQIVEKFAGWFGKEKGAVLINSPLVMAKENNAMTLNSSKEPEHSQQIDYTVSPSKDRGFEKKLRWQIENPISDMVRWKITPEMAAVMLTWNDRNRSITQSSVDRYARMMSAGRWHFTGQPIIFSAKRLIDGQHRLAAIVKAGIAIDALIVFGAPDDSFAFIDVGRVRTAADVFSIHNVKFASIMASAVKWIYEYENGRFSNAAGFTTTLDHEALFEEYQKHPGLQDSAWVAGEIAKTRLCSPSLMVAVHYVAAKKSRKEADEFFKKVGEGLGFTGKKDPAYKLHRRLIDSARSQEKLGRLQLTALVIKSWNAHRLGRDVGTLKFSPDETFPKVI